MNEVKKDHSIGSGTGAVGGAIAGAAIGSAGGPAGSAVGAVIGAVVGAKAGDSIAEAVNPTDYTNHFHDTYAKAPYYVSGREWPDYAPAYQYGYDTYGKYRGQRFEDVDNQLARDWMTSRGQSRLAWDEAKGAVRDGWNHIERAVPGDRDRDGR